MAPLQDNATGYSKAIQTHPLLITMDKSSYLRRSPGDDPKKLHDLFRQLSSERTIDPDKMQRHILDSTYRLVHGSNNIEDVSFNLNTTVEICRTIFEGSISDPFDLIVLDVEIYRQLGQHLKAAQYLICQTTKSDLSEDTIKEAHRILTNEFNQTEGTYDVEYSGKYRTSPLQATSRPYMDPNKIPAAMDRMMASYRADTLAAGIKGEIDPVALAAKYSHIFFSIHPFHTANGQMSRLILNAILFKWAGCLAPFGQDEEECAEYLSIIVEAMDLEISEAESCHGVSDGCGLKLYKKLASYILKHAAAGMLLVCEPLQLDE
ncbi:adenosine monophosphate transferase FICD like [Fusarium mundagurra]|uniref:Adenosine monophosphate transferase FICD like n=1 Tax=Fusarium mundagurra TaxID=1567541 RepID=A0A8H6D7D5_9HYPO|nr:adenosine monophosphate transferase FICD like [Fusarium mundagurra]